MSYKDLIFLNPIHPFQGMLLFLVICIYFFIAYRKFSTKVSWRLHSLLICLRLLVFGVTFFILLDPYWNQPGKNEWLGVLYDASESLNVKEQQNDTKLRSRLALMKSVLKNNDFWKKLERESIRKKMLFSDTLRDLISEKELNANGVTKLKQALKQIGMSYKNEEGMLGWVLFSDGAATDWTNEDILRPEQFSFPWITVAVGHESDLPNVIMNAPEFEKEIFVGEILDLKIKWQSNLALDTTTTLKVDFDGKEIVSQEIQLSDTEKNIQIPVQSAGFHSIDIALKGLAVEASERDNQARIWIEAFPRKIRVYYVESYYKDENLFKKALEEDDVFEVDFSSSLIGFSRERGVAFVGDSRLGFPNTREKLLSYDVIVLSDVNRKLLSANQISWMRELVEEKGGAVVMIGGVDSFGDGGYVGTDIEKMLPVEISEQYKKDQYLSAKGTVEQTFLPLLTGSGRNHPMMRLADSLEANEVIWKEMPLLGGYNYVGRLKSGAVSLLEHPVDKSKYGPRIILAVQDFGLGKTLAFTSDVTYNWGQWLESWTSKDDEWLFATFWRKSFKWLTEKRILERLTPLKVSLSRNLPEVGMPLKLQIEFPRDYEINSQDRIQIEVKKAEKILYDQSFKNRANEKMLTVDLPEFDEGDHVVSIKFLARDQLPFEKKIFFYVQEDLTETRHLNVKDQVLQKIADLSGGEFLKLSEIHKLEGALDRIRRSNLRQTSKPYWHQLPFFLVILTLLTLDWFVRKKKNLE